MKANQAFGTNVIPLGMTRDELRDGYIGLMRDLHDPEFYFERLENLFLTRRFNFARTRNAYWRRHPWIKRKSQSVDALRAAVLFIRLMRNVPDPELRRIYRRRMTTMLRHRPDPNVLFICVVKCAIALPPLHIVPSDGPTAETSQHILEASTYRPM